MRFSSPLPVAFICSFTFKRNGEREGGRGSAWQRLAPPPSPPRPSLESGEVPGGPGEVSGGPRGVPRKVPSGPRAGSRESRCGSGEDPGGVRGGSSGRIGQPRGGGVGYGRLRQAVGTGVRGAHKLRTPHLAPPRVPVAACARRLPTPSRCVPLPKTVPPRRGTGSKPTEGRGPRRGAPGAPRGPAVPVGRARVCAGARARCPGLEVCTRGGACPRVCAHLPRAHAFGQPHLPREQVRGNAALLRGSGAQRGGELQGPPRGRCWGRYRGRDPRPRPSPRSLPGVEIQRRTPPRGQTSGAARWGRAQRALPSPPLVLLLPSLVGAFFIYFFLSPFSPPLFVFLRFLPSSLALSPAFLFVPFIFHPFFHSFPFLSSSVSALPMVFLPCFYPYFI